MNRYRKLHKFTVVLVLLSFLSALSGVSALAGHPCCGNCAERISTRQEAVTTLMAADSCCPISNPIEPTCTCTFQSSDDQDRPVFSLTQVSTACDDLLKGWTAAGSTNSIDLNSHRTRIRTTGMKIRARSGPLYLINQAFLC